MVALFNIRGHPNVTRNSDVAVAWARYVAETSPALGRILAKGLKAFRHHNWYGIFFVHSATYLKSSKWMENMDDNGCNISNFELLQFFHPENKLLKEIPEIVNFHKKLWLATLVLPASAMCHMSMCILCLQAGSSILLPTGGGRRHRGGQLQPGPPVWGKQGADSRPLTSKHNLNIGQTVRTHAHWPLNTALILVRQCGLTPIDL